MAIWVLLIVGWLLVWLNHPVFGVLFIALFTLLRLADYGQKAAQQEDKNNAIHDSPPPGKSGIIFDDMTLRWDNSAIQWDQLIYIEMYKQWSVMYPLQRPDVVLEFGLNTGGAERIFSLPRTIYTPLYSFLSQRFGIAMTAIEEVLYADRNCYHTLWTRLPELELNSSVPLDSQAMACQLQDWLQAGASGTLRLGPLEIQDARKNDNKKPFEAYPPQSIRFTFSGVNGKQAQEKVAGIVSHLRPVQTEPPYELNPDWHKLLEWKGNNLEVKLYFGDGGHGEGWIAFSTSAYLAWLHTGFPEKNPPVAGQILRPDLVPCDIYYSDSEAGHISPRLDPLADDVRVTFWCAGDVQGFSAGPWSVRWLAGEITEFTLETEDEVRDRGGPYNCLRIRLVDGGCYRIKTKRMIDADRILDLWAPFGKRKILHIGVVFFTDK